MRRAAALTLFGAIAVAPAFTAQSQSPPKPPPPPFASAVDGRLFVDARGAAAGESLRVADVGTGAAGDFADLVFEAGPALAAGPGCGFAVNPRTGASGLRCQAPTLTSLVATFGNFDDHFDGGAVSFGQQLFGLGGADTLIAGPADDVVEGDAGDDVLNGAGGSDTLRGGPGNDTLSARDGRTDVLSCGPGDDTATADLRDLLFDCESATVAPLGEAPHFRIVALVRRPDGVAITLRCRVRLCAGRVLVTGRRLVAARRIFLRSRRRSRLRIRLPGHLGRRRLVVRVLERDRTGRPLITLRSLDRG